MDDHGYIAVDERLKTSADGVYAIGDAKGGPAFTHVSYDDYRILAANLLGGGSSTTKDRLIPWAVYTDSQIGHIGRTEDQLKEAGVAYRVAKLPAHGMARAHETGRLEGFLKVLVAEKTDEVLGCVAVLPEGGEIATLAQVAMIGEVGARRLANSILIHPSWAEAFN
ncbi:MAG: FAD-containing oxidoreductase, partial [Armatimonadota bacterium]